MDGSGRNFVTLNRFFSAQQIVRSNEENGETSNQERDGAIIYSDQHGQYDGRSNTHAFRQLQPPSNNPGIFGSPEYWQYGSRTHHEIGGPMSSNTCPSSSTNPSFFRSSTNQYGPYNEGINQDFGGPINSFHPQFQSSANSRPIFGGTNNYYGQFDGRSSHGIGSPINSHGNQFQSPFNNASSFGGPNNQYGQYGHHNRDNDSHPFHQFQTSNNRLMFGGPSDQHRGSHNYHVRNTHDAGQNMPLNNQTIDGAASYNNFSGLRYDERNKNGTSDSVNTISSSRGVSHSTNANEQITDGSTRIEHAKLKIKIAEIYREKALKPFTENSSRFDEDEWLKVWCIFSNGLRSYQCQMICPLCYKKVTPQNRSEPGSLPRWELTIVKGHLERIHATKTKRTAESSKHGDHVREDEEKNEEEGQKKNGKKAEIANEEEAQKIVEEKQQKTSEEKAQEKQEEQIEKSVTAELDLVSEPESLVKTSSSSSESSSDATELSSSDSDDTTVSTPERTTKRRKGTRKRQPSSKRGKVSSKSEIGNSQKMVGDVVVSNMRNLMNHSSSYILSTFSDHEESLKQIYVELISKRQRHYKPKDLPDLLEHDILNNAQLRAMAELAELKLVKKEYHNSTDVIFEAILPEWALAAFCKEYNLTRVEALQVIKKQNESLINDAN